MFREVAGLLPLVDAVVVGGWLCRHGHATPAALLAASVGCPRARHAASYVRARVDSPMESRVRMLLVLAGLPEPVVNADDPGDKPWRLPVTDSVIRSFA